MQGDRAGRGPGELAPDEVQAWITDIDAISEAYRGVLSRPESARAASYISPRDGARFAASRAFLRVILSRYLDAPARHLCFAVDPQGRPCLTGEHAGVLHFSLSRTENRALVAVSRSPLGADIEVVRARAGLADLITTRFSAAEARCIAGGCAGSPLRGFYRHWSAKEAYLKATGQGLAGLRRTELTCGARPVIRVGDGTASLRLSLLDVAGDCAVAIAGAGVVRCRVVSQ